MIKVALIGNMNNNNFSVLRYFRDLEVDAHLFLFEDEISGSLSHFHPKCDTWEYEKWNKYISVLPVKRTYPWCLLNPFKLKFHSAKKVLRSIFSDFDYFIGSGMVPTMMAHIGLRLDVFVPYSTGIEYYKNIAVIKCFSGSNILKKWAYKIITERQAKAIKCTKKCFNAEMGLTKDSFDELEVKFERLCLPTIYNREEMDEKKLSKNLFIMFEKIKKSSFKVISHSRLMWVRKKTRLDIETKNSDWLILAFKQLVDELNPNAALVLLEYGPDVEETKELCEKIGIIDKVIFLPKMSRKEIMIFLSLCDVISGEYCFDDTKIWGGTGWEALSIGKPLLQSVHLSNSEFKHEFGFPLPPVCNVKTKEDVYSHLLHLYQNPSDVKKMGTMSREWFNTYNGLNLSKEWISTMVGTDDILK